MSSLKWSTQEEQLLRILIPTNSPQEIAEEFARRVDRGLVGFEIPRTSEAVRRKCLRDGITPEQPNNVRREEVAEAFVEISKIQDIYREEYVADRRGVDLDITRKILSVSDIHFPLSREDLLMEVVEKHDDADIVVINGDMLDGYMFSSFSKEREIAALHEYKCAFDFVKYCSEVFPAVVLTSGNHEKRLTRALKNAGFTKNTFDIYAPDVMARLANGEELGEDGLTTTRWDFDNVFYQRREGWYARVGKTIFAHPHSKGSSVPGYTAKKLLTYFLQRYNNDDFDSIVVGHCFDDETEILTKRGWKRRTEISDTDEVGTLNLNSNSFEWNTIEAKWEYDHDGDLLAFGRDDNPANARVLVTEEHGMLWRDPGLGNSPWRKSKAIELEDNRRFWIPASCKENEKKEDLEIPDQLIELLAWIVTEGSLEISRSGGRSIRISQSKDRNDYVSVIDRLLKELGIASTKRLRYKAGTTEHGVHRNYDAYRWRINTEDTFLIMNYLTEEKVFKWEFLIGLSSRQRELLLRTLCRGDGSKCSSSTWRHYYSKDVELIGQVQYLLSVNGYASNTRVRKDGTSYISFVKTENKPIQSVQRVSYVGKVFCLTVPNGTLVIRKNGFVSVTQNTHKLSRHCERGTLLMEQGCFAGLMKYSHEPSLRYTDNAVNGYAVIYQDDEGNTDFNESRVYYLGEALPRKKQLIK